MDNEKTLTLTELEALVNDFFECRLTRQQENDLKVILLTTTLSSELIDECRLEIGLESTVGRHSDAARNVAALPQTAPRRRSRRMLKWLSIAACLVIALTVDAYLTQRNAAADSVGYAEVYINGQRVTDPDKAMEIAMHERDESLRMAAETLRESTEEQVRSGLETNSLQQIRQQTFEHFSL